MAKGIRNKIRISASSEAQLGEDIGPAEVTKQLHAISAPLNKLCHFYLSLVYTNNISNLSSYVYILQRASDERSMILLLFCTLTSVLTPLYCKMNYPHCTGASDGPTGQW